MEDHENPFRQADEPAKVHDPHALSNLPDYLHVSCDLFGVFGKLSGGDCLFGGDTVVLARYL